MGAVAQRVGDEFRHDHRGVLGEHEQAPAPEDLAGEVTGRPGSGHARVQGAGGDLAGRPRSWGPQGFGPRLLRQAGERRFLNAGPTPGPDWSAPMSVGHLQTSGGWYWSGGRVAGTSATMPPEMCICKY